jgi:hypothetical protein
MFEEIFRLFTKKAPVAVMLRGTLQNILSEKRLNAIFEDTAVVQRTLYLAFSTVVLLMTQVVMRIRPSVHAAYLKKAKEMCVGARCVYKKLDGIEPAVSRELVRRTGQEMERVILAMKGMLSPLLPGYRVRILDGNQLAGTHRRLKPLRGRQGAAMPGKSLAVLDPALKLVVDVFPCEDAYTQERALLPQVLDIIERGDLYIDDRNFCTTLFLFGIAKRPACFLVRQHAQSLHWELLGERVYKGEVETGLLFEQQVRLTDDAGNELFVRRITIELYQPTRDGEMVLHLLTNLPEKDADARTVARLYIHRWQIETAFQELTVDLACEVNTLGYPKAALFAFCVAVVCYNAFSVVKAAIRTKHREALGFVPETPCETTNLQPACGGLVLEMQAPDRAMSGGDGPIPVTSVQATLNMLPTGNETPNSNVADIEASLAGPVTPDVVAPGDAHRADTKIPPDANSAVRTSAAMLEAKTLPKVASRKDPIQARLSGDELSTYYMADEVAGMWQGMMVVLPERFWEEKFANLTPEELAATLTEISGQMRITNYRKRPPSRKRVARNRPCQPGSHVSTARVLNGTTKVKKAC